LRKHRSEADSQTLCDKETDFPRHNNTTEYAVYKHSHTTDTDYTILCHYQLYMIYQLTMKVKIRQVEF